MPISRRVIESAQRTFENSPAIHRWERMIIKKSKSAKRTADSSRIFSNPERLSPASRAFGSFLVVTPALKCWAIFERPLRGLNFRVS